MKDGFAQLVNTWADACIADVERPLPPPVLAAGSILRPPADPDQIVEAERRLGVSLPTSYRRFLALSDGAYADSELVAQDDQRTDTPVPFCGLLPAAGLTPVRDALPEMVKTALEISEYAGPEARDDHEDGESVWAAFGDLADAVLIDSLTADERGKFFLCLAPVPAEVDAGGEGFEVWDYDVSGTDRYLTFERWLRSSPQITKWQQPDRIAAGRSQLAQLPELRVALSDVATTERALDPDIPPPDRLSEVRFLRWAHPAPSVAHALTRLAADPDPYLRLAAAQAATGHDLLPSGSWLRDLANDSEPTVALAAQATLRLLDAGRGMMDRHLR